MSEDRLFIKVILPKQAKEQKKIGRGAEPEPFKTVTTQFRNKLLSKVHNINKQFENLPQELRAIPARVTIEAKALAKTHTPTSLFNEKTWSIIGKGETKEIFVKVTKEGTRELERKIERSSAKDVVKAISTIVDIEPVNSDMRLSGISPQQLFNIAPERNEKKLIKVKLFNFGETEEQEKQNKLFEEMLNEKNISFSRLEGYVNQSVYQLNCENSYEISDVSNAVMVRSISHIPVLQILRDQNFHSRPIPATLSQPNPHISYPIVAVVDSGLNHSVEQIKPWIYKQEKKVLKGQENTYHGTFVAGLIVWGKDLNPHLKEVEDLPCRILDIQVLPNNDSSKGDIGILTESELIQRLEDVLLSHSNEVKVWNLSLGTDEICELNKFSDFAIQLDELQEKFDVTFVIAAGNSTISNLMPFPRNRATLENGRIAAPADSVLGITVGSVSQINHPTTGTKYGEPSPFSRNGPGPNHIIKPDFVHCGGNIGIDTSYPLGITSICGQNSIGDNIGTSFAAPLVSRKLAYVYDQITPTPSSIMVRGLLTHSARDLRTMDRVPEDDNLYLGFGTPTNIDISLKCQPWLTTLVFEEALREGYELEWDHFPYPESLISEDGKFTGEIWMTLAYIPKRNSDYGSEYCETHVDAHFGTVDKFYDGDRNQIKDRFKGQIPQEHLKASKLFESFQVEKLRKWSPVRTYYRNITRGISGERWKLKVNMITRHNFIKSNEEIQKQLFSTDYLQKFALILTIADPNKRAPIYDEMARILRTRFQSRNLQVRPTIQVRT